MENNDAVGSKISIKVIFFFLNKKKNGRKSMKR